MKVELKDDKKVSNKPYPKLMKHSETGSIWLMPGRDSGTILYVGERSVLGTGDHVDCHNMSNLEDFEGSICLSND